MISRILLPIVYLFLVGLIIHEMSAWEYRYKYYLLIPAIYFVACIFFIFFRYISDDEKKAEQIFFVGRLKVWIIAFGILVAAISTFNVFSFFFSSELSSIVGIRESTEFLYSYISTYIPTSPHYIGQLEANGLSDLVPTVKIIHVYSWVSFTAFFSVGFLPSSRISATGRFPLFEKLNTKKKWFSLLAGVFFFGVMFPAIGMVGSPDFTPEHLAGPRENHLHHHDGYISAFLYIGFPGFFLCVYWIMLMGCADYMFGKVKLPFIKRVRIIRDENGELKYSE